MPDIPGIHMRLDPKRLTVSTFDPLEKDQPLLEKIQAVMRKGHWGTGYRIKAVKASTRTLDADMFKTLVIELRLMEDLHPEDQKVFRIVSGELPTMEQIESMPGRELNSPGCSYVKSKYKDDADPTAKVLRALREAGILGSL